MKALLTLAFLAAAGSASVSTVLALLAIWAGLIAFLLLAVNRYRDAVEADDPMMPNGPWNGQAQGRRQTGEETIAYIGAKRLVRKGRR